MSSQSCKRLKITRKPKPTTSSSSSIVDENDDLLIQILLRLPIKSLLKFKSVSKRWLSLISNPQFSRLRTPFLIFPIFSITYRHPHFNLADFNPNPINPNPNNNNITALREPFESLTPVRDSSEVKILQSCNGLLLCCSNSLPNNWGKTHYYVYNPTTKQYSVLPPLKSYGSLHKVLGLCLAFDPSKSPHYKVVCVRHRGPHYSFCYQIEIYSSENGPWSWRVSSCSFTLDRVVQEFHLGVFWNGAVHWLSNWENSIYFKVDEEEVRDMPMPSIVHREDSYKRRIEYFEESRGHLHLIEMYGPRALEFNVYEMKRDYSGWFVKYHVDLNAVSIAFPEIILKCLPPSDWDYYSFGIISVITAEPNENSFLVLNISGDLVRYNFEDKSFHRLYDITGTKASRMRDRSRVFQIIESDCCV